MRKLLTAALLGLAATTTVAAPPAARPADTLAVRPAAKRPFFVSYVYYKKNRTTGVVMRISSGRAGPFSPRREAQSTTDWYNAQDMNSGQFRYYYLARVVEQ